MSLSQKLTFKAVQTLALTPQMAQSLKLLEMNNLDLMQELQNLVTDNPFLAMEREEFEASDNLSAPEFDNLSYENTWSHSPTQKTSGEFSILDTLANEAPTLREHLTSQINTDFANIQERFIALSLIDYLDEAGYFRGNLLEISKKLRINSQLLHRIMDRLKELDPPGIFASNLQECLRIQLKEKGLLEPKMERFMNGLDLFSQGQFDKLKKRNGLSDEDITKNIKLIRELNPKPGLQFLAHAHTAIVPDIILKPKRKGEGWQVILNPTTLPKVLINHQYYAEITQTSLGKTSLKYIKDNYSSAHWLIKALQQRAETILKAATEIVVQQRLFFERGVSALKPYKLSEVAEKIEMHESTISRAVNNKFMATPFGTFELKYFFTSALASAFGDKDLSSESVRHRIRHLIEREDKQKPLSDDQLAETLKNEGMNVARRTVAKYRDSLGFSSSFNRKKWSGGHNK